HPLSLHDALPIFCLCKNLSSCHRRQSRRPRRCQLSATQPIAAQPTLSAKPTCLYLVRIPLFKAPPEAIGVVDTDQVFAAHPPTSDSPEARANAISEIQRASVVCARAYECGVVLDISGNSTEGYPFVLSAVETLDLTYEVIQQLRQ